MILLVENTWQALVLLSREYLQTTTGKTYLLFYSRVKGGKATQRKKRKERNEKRNETKEKEKKRKKEIPKFHFSIISSVGSSSMGLASVSMSFNK